MMSLMRSNALSSSYPVVSDPEDFNVNVSVEPSNWSEISSKR